MNWLPTATQLPERDQRVDWIAPSGDTVYGGQYCGGAVWFLPDSPMYVYYTPAFWRPSLETGT